MIKKTLAILFFFLLLPSVFAVVSFTPKANVDMQDRYNLVNGVNITILNAGLGMSPVNRLDVNSSGTSSTPFRILNSNGTAVFYVYEDSTADFYLTMKNSSDVATVFFDTQGNNYLLNNLGLGMNTPSFQLDVTGNSRFLGNMNLSTYNLTPVNEVEATLVDTTNLEADNLESDLDGTGYDLIIQSVDTGQGANELYDMNQNLNTTDSVTFASINTGQGPNELYDMNQNVNTTNDVTFNTVSSSNISGNLTWTSLYAYPAACSSGYAITQLDDSITCSDSWLHNYGDTVTADLNWTTATGIRNISTLTAAGDLDIGGYELRAQTLESDVAQGTAPLTIASTTIVSNLNVSYSNSSLNWDNLGSPSDINTADLTDDNTYVTVSGDTMSGNLVMGNNNVTGATLLSASTLTSTVAAGTAPFTVTSSTQVSNLNASYSGTAYDLTCTDCIGTTEISDVFVLLTGDTMTGDLNMAANLTIQANNLLLLTANTTAVICDSSAAGAIYYNGGDNTHYGCNSTHWRALY